MPRDPQRVHVVRARHEGVDDLGELPAAERPAGPAHLLADSGHEIGDDGVRGALAQVGHAHRPVAAQPIAGAAQDHHLPVEPVEGADPEGAVPEQLGQGHLVLVDALGQGCDETGLEDLVASDGAGLRGRHGARVATDPARGAGGSAPARSPPRKGPIPFLPPPQGARS